MFLITAQIPDEFTINGEKFSLVGLKGQGLFTPEDFGIRPHFTCTACWRGYVMEYNFINNKLVLTGMRVNVNEPTKINSVEPQKGDSLFKFHYNNLNLKTHFTGSVLLAKDFIQSMYVHMGFQRPMAFKTVVEIHVENGNIISLKDLSKQMEEKRKQNPYEGAQPQSNTQNNIERWIKQTFSLDYD